MLTLGLGVQLVPIAFRVTKFVEAKAIELIRVWEVFFIPLEAMAVESDPEAFWYGRAI